MKSYSKQFNDTVVSPQVLYYIIPIRLTRFKIVYIPDYVIYIYIYVLFVRLMCAVCILYYD